MKNIITYSIFLVFVIHIQSCNIGKQTSVSKINSEEQDGLFHIKNEYFSGQDSIQVIPNSDQDLILYLTKSNKNELNPNLNLKFVVFNKNNHKVIYKNEFSNSDVKWYNNTQLLLTRKLGNLNKETGMSIQHYIIDVYSSTMKEIKHEKQFEK